MKQFYCIRCDPDLGEGFYDMRRIPFAFTGCVEQLSKPCLPNSDKPLQRHYAIKPETWCTLPYYVVIINGIFQNRLIFGNNKPRWDED